MRKRGCSIKLSFKAASKSGGERRFSTYMVMTILITLFACGKLTYDLIDARKLPTDYDSIDSDIRIAAADVAELGSIPELPLVPDSWDHVLAAGTTYGFDIKPFATNDQDVLLYQGPLKSWSGTIRGNKQIVLRAVRQLQKRVPMYLFEYKTEDDEIFLNFSVVGT